VHVDGARISNAAAALGMGLKECTRDLGVDVLTFGGTKNGLLFGEAIVFFDDALHRGAAKFARKQGMQLASKMRYVAAQFCALLENDRWRAYATHANEMARRLEERVREIPGIRITRPVQCNAIFATLERGAIERASAEFFFYCFDDELPEVRWMTHHATRAEDVDAFAAALTRAVSAPVG
jgi:threonine aldolase